MFYIRDIIQQLGLSISIFVVFLYAYIKYRIIRSIAIANFFIKDENSSVIILSKKGTKIKYVDNKLNVNDLEDLRKILGFRATVKIFNQKKAGTFIENNKKIKCLRYRTFIIISIQKRILFKDMLHEIRTPLNGIIGMIELAKYNHGNPAYLEKARLSANYLLNIINDYLDIAKIDSNKMTITMEEFNLNSLVTLVTNNIYAKIQEKNIKFTTKIDAFHENFLADKVKITQILTNILSNATKFTPSLGNISLTINEHQQYSNIALEFIIEDNGTGMSEEFQKRLFNEFEQEKCLTGTSGLGLMITKKLVGLMGGTIHFSSCLNKGTTFKIIIPVTEAVINPKDEDTILFDYPDKHVLLVEDNIINQEVVCGILGTAGIKVSVADNASEALELFNDSNYFYYDLILMDINMPGINGYQATREIRHLDRDDKDIPIIAITADTDQLDKEKATAFGMNDHISKPFHFDELLDKLNKYFT